MHYKGAWTAELATRAAKGLTGPAPDHLIVDLWPAQSSLLAR
jgi:hypothetical protein